MTSKGIDEASIASWSRLRANNKMQLAVIEALKPATHVHRLRLIVP